MTANFNWHYDTAHPLGHSHVRTAAEEHLQARAERYLARKRKLEEIAMKRERATRRKSKGA